MRVLVVSSTAEVGAHAMTAAAMAFPWAQRQAYLDPLLAIKCNQSWGADMVICEFALRIIDGIQLIKLLRQQNRNIAPVLLERDGRHSRDADNLDISLLAAAEPSALKRIWEQEENHRLEKMN